MNTSQLFDLCLCAAGVAFIYLISHRLIVWYASAELSKSGASVAANADDRVTIIVNIPKSDVRKDEMKEIVRMMRRRHKNIFYRMT